MGIVTKLDERRHPTPSRLNEKQHIAIRELVAGKTDEEAAKAAGVSRQCLNGWKNGNPFFIAELTAKRAEAWQQFLKPIGETITVAFSTVETAIKGGDVKAAIWLLDKLGIDDLLKDNISQRKAIPRDPFAVMLGIAHERARRRVEALNLDPIEHFGEGDKLQRRYYVEELEALQQEFADAKAEGVEE